MKRMYWLGILAVVVAVGLHGCADPAANKPAAEVNEPAADDSAEAPAKAEEMAATGDALAFTDDSTIGFVGSKVTGSHEGGFEEFTGTVTMDGDDITTAVIDVTIDMDSTWSDNDRLTGHLKNEDFFDVPNFPESKFTSTAIEVDGDSYKVTGDLTLHGVTKSISFPATIDYADGTLTANAEFSINRFDFGIEYPGKTDDLIRELVLLKLNIVAQ